jgi:hypothetical protein
MASRPEQSLGQRKTVQRVMHEFKHGELRTARGTRKVRNPEQAIAIAMREEGQARDRRNLARTKARDRAGAVARAAAAMAGAGRVPSSMRRPAGAALPVVRA